MSAAPDETKVSASVFPLNGESKLVWVSPRHRQVLKTLDAGIQDGRGVLLLLGEAGSGKTVLTRALINGLVGTGVRVGWLPSPALDLVDFRKVLGEGWLPDGEAAGGDFPEAFRRYLRDVVVQGQRVLLVIDDAQTLRPELFVELQRLLEVDQHPNGDQIGTFNILLVGRSELASLLREPQHAALAMRIKVRCPLGPLTADEVARYVAHHLGAAGLGFDWFTHEAIEEICTHSGGLPRTINLICERALRTAQQAGAPTVDAGLIRRSLAGESADGGAQSKGIVRTLLELPRPLLADAPRHEAEASTTETRPEEVGDLPANVAGPDRSRRIVRVGGATALVALAAGVLLYLGWWSPSPQAPKSSASSVIEQKVEPAPVEMPERPEPPVAAVAPPAPPRSAPAPNGERPRALAAEKTPQRPEPTIVPSFPPPSRAAAPSTEKAVTPERAIAQEKAVTPERPVTPERVVAPEKASAPERTGPQPPVPAPTSQLQARPTAPAVVRPPSPATDEPDPTAIIDWLLKQSPGRID